MTACCVDVDVASIYESEPDMFSRPVLDETEKSISAPDFRKTRQYEELFYWLKNATPKK